MDTSRSIDQLCTERGIDARQLAERSGVDEQRVVAIVLGRWMPSPEDRDHVPGRTLRSHSRHSDQPVRHRRRLRPFGARP